MAQLLLGGIPPYASAYNMKMPGIYGVYAVILGALGQTPAAIRLGLLLANCFSIILVFCLARRLLGRPSDIVAAASFAVLALSREVLGFAASAEQFLLVPVLGATLLLLRARRTGRLAWFVTAGILFGLGFIVKQSGVAFVAFGLLDALVDDSRAPLRRRVVTGCSVLAGALLPFVAICVLLAGAGVFPNFWFWTFRYAAAYATATSFVAGAIGLVIRTVAISASWAPVLALAALGVSALASDPALRAARSFVFLFLAFSFLAVSPGLYFRAQYFVLLLPAVSLVVAVGSAAPGRLVASRWPRVAIVAPLALATTALLYVVYTERFILFQAAPAAISRAVFVANPFAESIAVADYIKRHTSPRDAIAVFGSEPEIYFYAGRPGATGYIYMYPLMEDQPYARAMQQQMIKEVEAARPTYVVQVSAPTSWLTTPASDPTLSRWLPGYLENFERVGIIDILSPHVTRYFWDEAARGYSPQSNVWLAVYRRKEH